MTNTGNVLHTEKWLNDSEIFKLLSNVEYIVMAQPNLDESSQANIHFTLFLNTAEDLPQEIISQILDKFSRENSLSMIGTVKHLVMDIYFAQTNQPTPMPYYNADNSQMDVEEAGSIKNLILDFTAKGSKGYEKIKEGLTGWSYVYND